MNNFKDRLAKVKDAWNKTKKSKDIENGGGFPTFEDGRYVGQLVGAKLGESKNISNPRLQICWTWKFYGGCYDGQQTRDYDGIETEENLLWLARKLNRLNVELPDDITEMEDFLNELVEEGIWASFTLKTKGDFQNLYINKVLSEEDAEAEAAADDDEDF